jgi:hypothetical protein
MLALCEVNGEELAQIEGGSQIAIQYSIQDPDSGQWGVGR